MTHISTTRSLLFFLAFYTCYGCPETTPSPDNPNPTQKNKDGSVRHRISNNCDTPFWDPIKGACLESGFEDQTRSIGPNGENSNPGGTNSDGSSSSGTNNTDPYTSFSGSSMGVQFAPSMLGGALALFAVAMAM